MESLDKNSLIVNLFTERYRIKIMLPHDFSHNKLTAYPYSHIHPVYEVIMIRDDHQANRNRVIITPPLTKHFSFNAEKNNAVWAISFLFHFEALEKPISYGQQTSNVLESFLTLARTVAITDSFGGMQRVFLIGLELEQKLPGFLEKITGEMMALMIDLARQLTVVSSVKPGIKRDLDENKLYLIDSYFAWNFRKPNCSKKELAHLLCVSERQLSRILQAHYNSSFRAILLQTRMENAKALRRLSNLTEETIAERVGYRSVKSFQEAYRRYRCMTNRSDS